VAALFYVFEGSIGAIDAAQVESASQIATWHLVESKRFLGERAMPQRESPQIRETCERMAAVI
jgi:putative DNA primase/helicase